MGQETSTGSEQAKLLWRSDLCFRCSLCWLRRLGSCEPEWHSQRCLATCLGCQCCCRKCSSEVFHTIYWAHYWPVRPTVANVHCSCSASCSLGTKNLDWGSSKRGHPWTHWCRWLYQVERHHHERALVSTQPAQCDFFLAWRESMMLYTLLLRSQPSTSSSLASGKRCQRCAFSMKSPDPLLDVKVEDRQRRIFKDFTLSSQACLLASIELQVLAMQSSEDQAGKSPNCSWLAKVSWF